MLPKGADHDYRSLSEDSFEKMWFNISGTLYDELILVYGITGTPFVKGTDVFPIIHSCKKREYTPKSTKNKF